LQHRAFAMRSHSAALKHLIGDEGKRDSRLEVREVKGMNLHNCFQFTEAPCANEEKYVGGPLRDTAKRHDSSTIANVFWSFTSLFFHVQ